MPTDHKPLLNGVRINTGISGQSVVQEVERVRDGIVDQLSRSVMHTCERGVREALIQLGWTPPGENRTQWHDIASAPNASIESVPFLVLRRGVVIQVSWFQGLMYPDARDACIDYDDGITDATHWQPRMPLPAPPTTD